jgi:hypothetical protein
MSDSNDTDFAIEYRAIEGFPGYEVGNDGSVWSFKSGVRRQLKSFKEQSGRIQVCLCRDKIGSINKRVHRLVLAAFCGECPKGMEACHNDGDPSNNHIDNLRWDFHSGNMSDRIAHGTVNHGERNGSSKLQESDIINIRNLSREGLSQSKIGARFGITQSHVSDIVNRKKWMYL